MLGGTASFPSGVSYSFWAPAGMRPLTVFYNARLPITQAGDAPRIPDPSGTLDARLEAPFGIALVQALPSRPDDPWVGKTDLADAGDLDAVLKALNPQLAQRLASAQAEAVGGTTYYTYELNNTQTKFANRRLIKLAIAGGELIGIDARCNEAQWGEAESKLKPLVGSFRLGAEAAPAP